MGAEEVGGGLETHKVEVSGRALSDYLPIV